MQRLLSQWGDVQEEIQVIDRLLRLGASTELISRFYGLTHQEIAVRRGVLGLPKRKGRHPVLTEEQDCDLWNRWSETVKERGIALTDETAMLGIAADLAENMSLPISVIWSAIGRWIDEGLV